MASTATETDICNSALDLVAVKIITDFDSDDTKQGRACRRLYPLARDSLLSMHDWRFATGRAVLNSPSGETLPKEWAYVYSLPADCLRVRYVESDQVGIINANLEVEVRSLPFPNWERRGRLIYSDKENAVLIYTKQITEPGLFDPLFADALVSRLAVSLALHMRLDAQLVNAAEQSFQIRFSEARKASQNEASNRDETLPDWIEARA